MNTRGLTTRSLTWTRWRVLRTLNDMIYDLEREPVKKQTLYLKTLFVKRRINRETARRWELHYGDDEEIRGTVMLIRDILEARIVERGLDKKTDPFFSAFVLKNTAGFQDDPQQAQRDETRLQIETESHNRRLAEARNRAMNLDTKDEPKLLN